MPRKSQSSEAEATFRTQKIGTIAVDTGQIVILDPSRVEELDKNPEDSSNLAEQLGEFVVRCSTGLGDGRYPVFADILDVPHVGTRVMAIHIFCDPVYCFADDPNYAAVIAQRETDYLESQNS